MEETEILTEETMIEDDVPEIPLPLRLLKGFEFIEEAEFWPENISNVMKMLLGPISFKEFQELINQDNTRLINNMESSLRDYRKEYTQYLKELEQMKNTFSFDVDYI